MPKLTRSDITHIAHLAKLELTPAEIAKYLPQLLAVFNYFDGLTDADITGVEPTHQTTGIVNNLRTDSISAGDVLSRDAALSGTDELHNDYFKVPMILTGRSDK